MARLDPELPQLLNAVETMRYLPNQELQQDGVVDLWLSLIGDLPPWPNPGRLGQYEAALEWSLDTERTERWATLSVPCMVLAFEYDIDSPPERAREAASRIPNSTFVELPGASHLGVFTHSEAVAAQVAGFLSGSGGHEGHAGP
jgi:pimeloyl-ACP methyl ester carboxylesterase